MPNVTALMTSKADALLEDHQVTTEEGGKSFTAISSCRLQFLKNILARVRRAKPWTARLSCSPFKRTHFVTARAPAHETPRRFLPKRKRFAISLRR
ncbi:MAG: hypothetical protein AUG51_26700 [Acidobacteria bacterium 13_1_20CM_3_53_8]|nr:MAG: hypothetical protein AUG51_26700 [Acidobacteria bacterium 13_1_20CM_3_53_8]